jgi:predicted site-specific integrase-resolvase
MESTPKKGIIYARVSSSEQVDNTSLDSQEKYCMEYAQRESIEIVKVFREKVSQQKQQIG